MATTIEDDMQLIRDLIDWADSNAAEVARTIGVANTTINRFKSGTATTRLGRGTLQKLKEAYPRFPGFSAEPDLPILDNDREYLPVEILPSFAGMGGGGNGEGDIETGLVSRRLIVDELRAKPSDMLIIEARGDSMESDFKHGDQILIDKRDTNPAQPGPFALWDGDAYVVKLVERVPHKPGYYKIFSANSRYSEYEVEADVIQILGRPVWFGRRL